MTKEIKHLPESISFSRQQLHYWRKSGLFEGSIKTKGGQTRYSFQDILILKDIKRLKGAGISTYKIRTCYQNLLKWFPATDAPHLAARLMPFDKRVVFVHDGLLRDAFTGQAFLLNYKIVKQLSNQVIGLEQYLVDQADKNFPENIIVLNQGAEISINNLK